MAEAALRVLLIEDDEDDYLLVRDYLGAPGAAAPVLEWAATYEAGRAALARREHDIALLDYHLGAHNGLELLESTKKSGVSHPRGRYIAPAAGRCSLGAFACAFVAPGRSAPRVYL